MMKTLIDEDDFTRRKLQQALLKSYGPSHIAVNGKEAVEAFRTAGSNHVIIVMTTAHGDRTYVIKAIQQQCEHFLVKSVQKAKLIGELRKLGRIE
jgi:DNA-binding NtrC family response regulator